MCNQEYYIQVDPYCPEVEPTTYITYGTYPPFRYRATINHKRKGEIIFNNCEVEYNNNFVSFIEYDMDNIYSRVKKTSFLADDIISIIEEVFTT